MSDFLSNFDKKNYEKTISEKSGKKLAPESHDPMPGEETETRSARKKRSNKPRTHEKETVEAVIPKEPMSEAEPLETESEEFTDFSNASEPVEGEFEDIFEPTEDDLEDEATPAAVVKTKNTEVVRDEEEGTSRFSEEETEIDPTYKKRKRLKIIILQ